MKKIALVVAAALLAATFSSCAKKASNADNSLADLKSRGVFVLGLDDSFPPMGFRDEKNEIVGFDIDPVQIDGPIYQTVRQTAAEMDLSVIDLHSFTAGHPEWFDDGVHPNYEGNRAIAAYIFEAVQRFLSL